MGAACHPRLTPSECRGAVKGGFSRRMIRMTDRTIADRLDITPEEAALLKRFRPATRFGVAKEPQSRAADIRAETILERRERIRSTIAEIGKVPPVREMGRMLLEAGFRGNHQTVQNDYRALGIQSERTRAARLEQKSKQLVLSGV
jgi:hypothetical protein